MTTLTITRPCDNCGKNQVLEVVQVLDTENNTLVKCVVCCTEFVIKLTKKDVGWLFRLFIHR